MQKQELSGTIKFTVESPELIGSANKHHEYRIHGSDSLNQFDVRRRYSDFIILKQYMLNRWPGIWVPSLPEKKFIGNSEADFLIVRRDGLQKFLQLVSSQNYLWYSDEFQLFIKSKSNQVDKFLNNLGKTNYRQIATKYRIKFPQILQKNEQQKSIAQNNAKVNQFRAYLKNSQIVLQKLAKVSQIMTETRKRFNEKYGLLLGNILPEYEQKCVSQHAQEDNQHLYFMNSKTNGLAEIQASLAKVSQKSGLSVVNELIKQEIRQVLNFQQILKNKQQFQVTKLKLQSKVKDLQLEQTKINAGKQSILNKIKNASREQQLQQNKAQLLKARQQAKDAEQICKVIDTILAMDQIGKFKQARTKNYYKVVKEMALAQKQNYEVEAEFWAKISGGAGIIVDNIMQQKHENKQLDISDKLLAKAEFLDEPKQSQEHKQTQTKVQAHHEQIDD